MQTIELSLPDSLREFVQTQVAEGGYQSPSDFIEYLIRSAQKQRVCKKVDTMLADGIASGSPSPMTASDWENLRRRLNDRLQKRDSA